MILCVNLNAAIDKTIVVDSFRLGEIHRPEAVKSLPGGKGCNVARALKQFGEAPVVTGWVGGTAGQFIENGLRQEGIGTDFVYTDFESRTCTSILDGRNQVMTEIYEKGDPVPAEKVDELLARFGEMVGGYTAVTLSGSLPPGVPQDFYAQLIIIADRAGVPAFLDSSKEALLQGVAAKPFLIKPNESEVAILAGRELKTTIDFAGAAADISIRYGTIVVLSLGKAGAIAAQGQEVLHVINPSVEAKSAVGSGDCMLAGLAYGFTRGLYLVEAVKYGVAAGTANTLVIGAGQFMMTDFESILSKVGVETAV
ncbi:MAG: 1-phosphofructokinase family hexose kinase [Ardenticatenaceae bacterium]|nr:1-phosphofructokinase family hexose kinase [Ardenticatenaceae bacterium]